jgi:hypothetical protein
MAGVTVGGRADVGVADCEGPAPPPDAQAATTTAVAASDVMRSLSNIVHLRIRRNHDIRMTWRAPRNGSSLAASITG